MPILRARSSDPITEGVYLAKIVDILEDDGKFGKQVLKFTFELQDFEVLGRRLTKIFSATLSRKSNLGALASRLFGDEVLRPNAELDTTRFVGQLVTLSVKQAKRDDGSTFNTIKDVQVPRDQE